MSDGYMTREGGATVTIFVPYDCGNNCPFCINKQEYENPVGFSLEAICDSIRTMDEITPKCDFVFTGGEPFADPDALQVMMDCVPAGHRVFINTTLPVSAAVTGGANHRIHPREQRQDHLHQRLPPHDPLCGGEQR